MTGPRPIPSQAVTQPTTLPLAGKRVLALASFDSFLRAASRLAGLLQAQGAAVEYGCVYRRKGQLSLAQCQQAGLDAIPHCAPAADFATGSWLKADLVILALDNLRLREYIAAMQRATAAQRRPLTLALFPGLIFRSHYESFLSRSSCDLVLMNSPADQARYRDLITSLDLPDNSELLGLATLPAADQQRQPDPAGEILYVDQPTVPAGLHERLYVLSRMIELAERFPTHTFAIKPRHRQNETTLHRTQHHFEDLMQRWPGQLPPNLKVVHGAMNDALRRCSLVLTVSSTAALEALAFGIPTRILTDLGIHEQLGNHFFIGSGLFATFDEIQPGLPNCADPDWLQHNLQRMDDHGDTVVARVASLLASTQHTPPTTPSRLFGRSSQAKDYFLQHHGPTALVQFGDVVPRKPPPVKRALKWMRRLLP